MEVLAENDIFWSHAGAYDLKTLKFEIYTPKHKIIDLMSRSIEKS